MCRFQISQREAGAGGFLFSLWEHHVYGQCTTCWSQQRCTPFEFQRCKGIIEQAVCCLNKPCCLPLELFLSDLCLCFVSHQLSVVEYDPGTHDLKTLSLHYFEEPELRVCSNKNKPEFMFMCQSDSHVNITVLVFSGWLCTECTYSHCPCRSRESLCCNARLWHQTRGAAIPKGHANG